MPSNDIAAFLPAAVFVLLFVLIILLSVAIAMIYSLDKKTIIIMISWTLFGCPSAFLKVL